MMMILVFVIIAKVLFSEYIHIEVQIHAYIHTYVYIYKVGIQ